MKWKFQKSMEVTSDKLPEYHRLKGFEEGDVFETYLIDKDDDHSSARWGIWIASKSKNAIRLQDLGGMVTGHGTYFRPLTEEELKKLLEEEKEKVKDDFSLD